MRYVEIPICATQMSGAIGERIDLETGIIYTSLSLYIKFMNQRALKKLAIGFDMHISKK